MHGMTTKQMLELESRVRKKLRVRRGQSIAERCEQVLRRYDGKTKSVYLRASDVEMAMVIMRSPGLTPWEALLAADRLFPRLVTSAPSA